MSYTKDKDAHTRGVGAIAASDGSRVARRRKAMQAQALRSRDAALSTWTMGPGGGHPGLGAISQVGLNVHNPVLYGRPGSIDVPGTGIVTNPPLPGRPGGGGSKTPPAPPAPTTPTFGRFGSRRDAFMNVRKQSTGFFVAPPGPKRGDKGSGTAPAQYQCADGSYVTDVSLCPAPSDGKSGSGSSTDSGKSGSGSGSGSSSGSGSGSGSKSGGVVFVGGGGGGGGVPSGGQTAVTFPPPPDAPDLPAEATGMSTTKKIALAAAALGGLYLLFGKKDKEGQ